MSDKKQIIRRPDGKLAPGTATLNPYGKFKGIDRRIKHVVESRLEKMGVDGEPVDGWEAMTVVMYEVAMGRKPPGEMELDIKLKDRMAAITFLFDRVFGKPTVKIESEQVTNSGLAGVDVDALDPEDLDALEAYVENLSAKIAANKPPAFELAPVDAEIVEDLDAREGLHEPDPEK